MSEPYPYAYTAPTLSVFTKWKESANDFLRQFSPYLHYKITHIKPLSQFLSFHNLSIPKNFNSWKIRVSNNFTFFSTNYTVLSILVGLILLIQNWHLLLSILSLIIGFLLIQKYEFEEIHIFNRTIQLNKSYLTIALLVSTVPFIVYSSPIGTLLEIITYSLLSVGLHASFIDGFSGETSFNENVQV